MLFAISRVDLTDNGVEDQSAATIITESIDPDAKVIFGTINDERLKKGEIKVTVIATGFPAERLSEVLPPNQKNPVRLQTSTTKQRLERFQRF